MGKYNSASGAEAPNTDLGSYTRVAVIPARGGSKRIPNKNIRSFLGRPAIAYPIAAARRSGLFNRIVVSTDSPQVAEVALSCGAEVPFMRPAALADDYCGTIPVLQHAFQALEHLQRAPIHFACCIYPTAVLLAEAHLIEAYHQLENSPSTAYCFSVCAYHHPIQRALQVGESGTLGAVAPEHWPSRTQDLQRRYHDAGQFYWGTAEAIRAGASILQGASVGHVLSRTEFIDIDEPEDWVHAEALAMALGLNVRTAMDCQAASA
jgi:N-acylneuraminate cytidylyltransferase